MPPDSNKIYTLQKGINQNKAGTCLASLNLNTQGSM